MPLLIKKILTSLLLYTINFLKPYFIFKLLTSLNSSDFIPYYFIKNKVIRFEIWDCIVAKI